MHVRGFFILVIGIFQLVKDNLDKKAIREIEAERAKK